MGSFSFLFVQLLNFYFICGEFLILNFGDCRFILYLGNSCLKFFFLLFGNQGIGMVWDLG